MYKVTLSACGNIDHFENPFDNIVDKKRVDSNIVECASIEECQRTVRNYIDKHNLGGGSWSGGKVFKDGEQVGYISYNGRYWDKDSEYYR